MKVLFVHQNFPGQFKSLAPALQKTSEFDVAALSMQPTAEWLGIPVTTHVPARGGTTNIFPFAADFQTKMIRAASAAEAAERLKMAGYVPDLIFAHPGWGESLFLREIWPTARQLHFLEFFYHSAGMDTDFDSEFSAITLQDKMRIASKQAAPLMALEQMDWGVSPTQWQRSTYPIINQKNISVIHDGINTDVVRINKNVNITLRERGINLKSGDPVITFANRNLEPYRGYHIFMRSLPEILSKHPDAQVLIIGGDGVSYGAPPPPGVSWKQKFFDEVMHSIDKSRVHFLGNVPYNIFISILQLSAVHVYLTYPFVLSWSLLEAMACGCLIVGSKTAPVTEIIEDGKQGVLVDFFDSAALAQAVLEGLANPRLYDQMRLAARQKIIEKYDLSRICLPAQVNLIRRVLVR